MGLCLNSTRGQVIKSPIFMYVNVGKPDLLRFQSQLVQVSGDFFVFEIHQEA